jgi:hypothetical protein
VQALGESGATAVDADQRDRPTGVLLDYLVGDPHQGAAHVIVVEDDRGVRRQNRLLPGLTGPG